MIKLEWWLGNFGMRKNPWQGAKTTNEREKPIHTVKNVTFIYVPQRLKIVLNHFMKYNNILNSL
jgi:hypothetical protein